MSAKPVQVWINTELLKRVDEDPETRSKGRSAFVRSAIEFYLRGKEEQYVEAQIARAYSGEADAMLDEVSDFIPMTLPF